MGDWADDAERELMKWDLDIHKGAIAEALRKARADALDEAVDVARKCGLSFDGCAAVLALKDKL